MSAPTPANFYCTDGALHVCTGGEKFLELRADGLCVIRSLAPDGLVHMHVQRHRGLLRYIAEYPGSHFAIAVVALPEVIADRFTVRSVIAIYPDQDDPRCLLMAREVIDDEQAELLRGHMPHCDAVLSAYAPFVAPAPRQVHEHGLNRRAGEDRS